ncbi:hypothetical protein D3C72_2358870 [compost metagenome]
MGLLSEGARGRARGALRSTKVGAYGFQAEQALWPRGRQKCRQEGEQDEGSEGSKRLLKRGE